MSKKTNKKRINQKPAVEAQVKNTVSTNIPVSSRKNITIIHKPAYTSINHNYIIADVRRTLIVAAALFIVIIIISSFIH
jgi:hypothetical protein